LKRSFWDLKIGREERKREKPGGAERKRERRARLLTKKIAARK
jgi:hypothetical protein